MSQTTDIAEKNARVSARGEYMRWLAKRFGDLDLLLTLQGEDRVNLRKVYVPLRIDTQDRSDESMGGPNKVQDEVLPGRDALEVIAEQPFVAISGRPGSGKTTLIQAIISELAGERPNEFRRKLVGERGILPIPLILREYQDDLAQIQTLDDLLNCWWRKAEQEARDKGFALDLPRLRESYSPYGDRIPLLLLFDGIDEVGGSAARTHLAMTAQLYGNSGFHRTVITGRPTGFQGLRFFPLPNSDQLRSLLKNASAIRNLLHCLKDQLPLLEDPDKLATKFRLLREQTIAADTKFYSETFRREYDETAKLYQVSLVLHACLSAPASNRTAGPNQVYHVQPFSSAQIRQFIDQFFQIRREWQIERERLAADFRGALTDIQRPQLMTLACRPIFLTLMALVHVNDRRMPQGRADLYRRIVDLYLVRQTQQRRLAVSTSGDRMPHWEEREVRRALGYIAWRSQHKAAEVKDFEQRNSRQVIWSREDLEKELRHLLSGEDPALGRFTDIKQEDAPRLLDYFLHPTGLLVDLAEGRYQFAHLSFQEYLCAEYIHGRAKALGSRRFLDGIRELLYENLGLPGWDEVGLLLLCIHAAEGAQTERTAHLELLAELDVVEFSQAKLLLAALSGKELDYNKDQLLSWLPVVLATCLLHPEGELWKFILNVPDWHRRVLDVAAGFFGNDSVLIPFQRSTDGGRNDDPAESRLLNDCRFESLNGEWLNPTGRTSWKMKFGPDEARAYSLLRLINGLKDDVFFSGDRLALWIAFQVRLEEILQQWLLRFGHLFYSRIHISDLAIDAPCPTDMAWEFAFLVDASSPLWRLHIGFLPVDQVMLEADEVSRKMTGFSSYVRTPIALILDSPDSRSLPRPGLSSGLHQALLAAQALAGGVAYRLFDLERISVKQISLEIEEVAFSSPSEATGLSAEILIMLGKADHATDGMSDDAFELYERACDAWVFRVSAIKWFNEQAEAPDVMRRRSLRPGEPLPREFGIFDDTGRIKEQLTRESLMRLRGWVEDDDAVLTWFFPEGLSAEDDKDLREQLHILHHYERPDGGHGQPWSPIAALDAVLADWPLDQPTREVTLAAAERDLIAVLDELLAKEAAGEQPSRPAAGLDRPDIG